LIQGPQEQNQRLLKIFRDLGTKMRAEKEHHESLQQEQAKAVSEAHQALQKVQENLESQKKNHDVTIQAYQEERDAFKAMLVRADHKIESLAKCNQQLHKKFIRADVECHGFTEDLLTANKRPDPLHNESANIRAEKKIWEVG
jgi:wobble nucleotide-excising tRNase